MPTITTTTKPVLLALTHEPLNKVKYKTDLRSWLLIASALSMVGSALEVSATPVSNSWSQIVSRSLPPGWAIRVPSINWFNDRLGSPDDRIIRVISTNQSTLEVNIFDCLEQINSCFVGSVAVRNRKLDLNTKEFKQYQELATPIALS